MITPNPLIKENNRRIQQERRDKKRLEKLMWESLGYMVKIKEKKKDEDK